MKKIWIGGYASCDVHNEKAMIKEIIEKHKYTLTEDLEDADFLIIIDTCLGTYKNFIRSMKVISLILDLAKNNAQIIVSGCLTKGVKFELTEEQKELLSKVTCIKSEDLVPYVAKLLTNEITDNELDIPYTINETEIRISPVMGCLNNCSFCKTNFMNFNLKSYPMEKVLTLASNIEKYDYPFTSIQIFSSNLSLYGVDLYGYSRAHELIHEFTSSEKIKFAQIGALINWYPDLLKEILNNSKIKEIFMNLESGSPRIYNLMNRPISLEKFTQIIKFIKKERPDIEISSDIIIGFPTETLDDIKKTIDLVYELDINPLNIYPFAYSKQIKASSLPRHTSKYCEEASRYATEKLAPLKEKTRKMDMLILKRYEEEKVYNVQLQNGNYKYIRFDQLDRDYKESEIVKSYIVKPKQIIKKTK